MTSEPERTPRWIWAVMVGLAALQPIIHLGIQQFPPAGTVPTGLHVLDSAEFIHSMGMFHTEFESLYATCQSTVGDRSITLISWTPN